MKKLEGLPVQILGINLDKDAKETHKQCVEEGITWPSVHMNWKEIEHLSFTGIPQFFLVDAEGNVRFEVGGGPKFETDFMRELEKLLAEMGHEIDLVDPSKVDESSVDVPFHVHQKILKRLKDNGATDSQSLKEFLPDGLASEEQSSYLQKLVASRNSLAIQTANPQTLQFLREMKGGDDHELLNHSAWRIYVLSQEFDLGAELFEVGLELAERSVELDANPNYLDTYAHLLAVFPDRIEEAIEFQEQAIEVAKRVMETNDNPDLKSQLEQLQSFLEELESK